MKAIVNIERLRARLDALGEIGRQPNGSICRIALSDEDKQGRDLVVSWMKDLGLEVRVDAIGNIFGLRKGKTDAAPVMTGSHIDTVATGGKFDGNYGVLAGLEVVEALNDANFETKRPLCVAVFTNEEGVRFTPDMMGSLVLAGGLSLEDAYAATDRDGTTLKTALVNTGYLGDVPCGAIKPSAFIELHIEQGPVLEAQDKTIGVVENLQGISWQEITIEGEANHAGTTPMESRHDAGFAAGRIITYLREVAGNIDGQRATVGMVALHPDLINVVPGKATLTVDLRNADNQRLKVAEKTFSEFLQTLAVDEGVTIFARQLVRFNPVGFDAGIAKLIEKTAQDLNLTHTRMTSGAGHDAQMMARIAPAAMIFVPSIGGISHNGAEDTKQSDLLAGANVLMHSLLALANKPE